MCYTYLCRLRHITSVVLFNIYSHTFALLNQQILNTHLQRAVLGASVKLEVMDADSCDDMSLPSGVAGAVGKHHLVVAFTRPQEVQVLRDIRV